MSRTVAGWCMGVLGVALIALSFKLRSEAARPAGIEPAPGAEPAPAAAPVAPPTAAPPDDGELAKLRESVRDEEEALEGVRMKLRAAGCCKEFLAGILWIDPELCTPIDYESRTALLRASGGIVLVEAVLQGRSAGRDDESWVGWLRHSVGFVASEDGLVVFAWAGTRIEGEVKLKVVYWSEGPEGFSRHEDLEAEFIGADVKGKLGLLRIHPQGKLRPLPIAAQVPPPGAPVLGVCMMRIAPHKPDEPMPLPTALGVLRSTLNSNLNGLEQLSNAPFYGGPSVAGLAMSPDGDVIGCFRERTYGEIEPDLLREVAAGKVDPTVVQPMKLREWETAPYPSEGAVAIGRGAEELVILEDGTFAFVQARSPHEKELASRTRVDRLRGQIAERSLCFLRSGEKEPMRTVSLGRAVCLGLASKKDGTVLAVIGRAGERENWALPKTWALVTSAAQGDGTERVLDFAPKWFALARDEKNVYLGSGRTVMCLDAATGRGWRFELPKGIPGETEWVGECGPATTDERGQLILSCRTSQGTVVAVVAPPSEARAGQSGRLIGATVFGECGLGRMALFDERSGRLFLGNRRFLRKDATFASGQEFPAPRREEKEIRRLGKYAGLYVPPNPVPLDAVVAMSRDGSRIVSLEGLRDAGTLAGIGSTVFWTEVAAFSPDGVTCYLYDPRHGMLVPVR